MGFTALINRLYFEDKATLDQNIHLERRVEEVTVKGNRHDNLPFYTQATPLKPSGQNGFINTLEQARPKFAMNRD